MKNRMRNRVIAALAAVCFLLSGCSNTGAAVPDAFKALEDVSKAISDVSGAITEISGVLSDASGLIPDDSEIEKEVSEAAEEIYAEVEKAVEAAVESAAEEVLSSAAVTETEEKTETETEEKAETETEEKTEAETGSEADTKKEMQTEPAETEGDGKEDTEASGKKQESEEEESMQAAQINSEEVEEVISRFEKLTEIPRPSGHEEKVSSFLYAWAKKNGKNAKQDSYGNVIVDIPASEGCESKPLTVLQGHMDMVAVAEEGYSFDPLKDPIKMLRTETELTAEHTSLGGDDGIGVAIAQYIAEKDGKHGPLRLIFTTDEEVSQTGARNLDPEAVADATYLINIDSEVSDEMNVTSASSVRETCTKECEWMDNPWNNPVELRVTGGLGGHSGVEINEGRANANIVLADLLIALKEAGVRYYLASFEGGTADNAITAFARAVITVQEEDGQKLTEEVERFNQDLKQKYQKTDPEICCEELYPNLLVQKVLTEMGRDKVLALLANTVSGVHTMSAEVEDLVESSCNLGIVKLEEGKNCTVVACIRSSETYPEQQLVNAQRLLAEALGFTVETVKSCEVWPYDPENTLSEIAKEVYLEQNGTELKEKFIHAGLECGTFKKYNGKLKMISIGPDVKDAHTPKETILLSSVSVTLNLIEGILERIAE